MRSRVLLLAAAASVAASSCTDTSAPKTACDHGALSVASTMTGELSRDCKTPGDFSQPYADYHVTLISGERYLFTVRSESAWKPALYLRTPAGAQLPGWSDLNAATGAHSELFFVSPYTGPMTLRIIGTGGGVGGYTLRSTQCDGTSSEIYTHASVSVEGTIAATDCVVHDRYLPNDSTHADSYVLYLDRSETKTVTVAARGASAGTFHPAVIFSGPYVSGESTSSQHTVASGSATSLTVQLTGGNQAGTYILGVGGASPTAVGDYTLTIGPAAP